MLNLPDLGLGDLEGDNALPPDGDQALPPAPIDEAAAVVMVGSSIDGKTVQGHTDVIRALRDIQRKEMEAHQNMLQRNFEELIKVTRDGFGTLQSRIENIETAKLASSASSTTLGKKVKHQKAIQSGNREFSDYMKSVSSAPPVGDEGANPDNVDPESDLPPDGAASKGRRGSKNGRVPIKDLKKMHELQR